MTDYPTPAPFDRGTFDRSQHLTLGAEEELLLLDPVSFDLAPEGEALVKALGDQHRFRRELSPAQVEIVTAVGRTGAELTSQLADGRRRVMELAGGRVRLAAAGAHPFAAPWTEVSAGTRYASLLEDHGLGARLGSLAAGLHIHVGISGAERAVAVYNGLRELMPALIALTANAPFIGGRDSGLATVRCKLADALPRHGTGPAFRDWDAFAQFMSWGQTTGAVPDPSQYWWDCRLNTLTGTVEVRAPDPQQSLGDVEKVIAIVHAAAADLSERHDAGEPPPAHRSVMIEENRWRAARYGLSGLLLDLDHVGMAPARDVVERLLDRIEPAANRHGSGEGLRRARQMLVRDLPAELRAIAADDGMQGLCEWLALRTEQSALQHGSAATPQAADEAWSNKRGSPPTGSDL